jgi:hypothetical protein
VLAPTLTPAERTKLDGVAPGATANATDADLRDRSTHTGTQAASTITGLATVATSGSYNDLADKPAGGSGTADPTALTVGEAVAHRLFFTSTLSLASQGVRLSYFIAQKTEAVTQIRTHTGGTGAGATPTVCKLALYEVAANGDLTRIATTANDTTLWNAGNSKYTRSFTAPAQKTAGQQYAVAFLVVTSAAAPNTMATTNQFSNGIEQQEAPRMSGFISGQTDLAASYTAAQVQGSSQMPYAAILP